MRRIGIDFGTTNTTLAYYDEKHNQLCGYKFDNASEYISSAIAYHKIKNSYYIATNAQDYRDDSNFYFYEYYKIGLVKKWDKIVNENHGKTYFELMKDYLHKLISTYKNDNLLGDSLLDVIVLSVPNILLSNDYWDFKNELEKFLKTEARTGIMISEPACSAAFYSKVIQPEFYGDLIVVDYGGGTLDVSICRVNKELNNGNMLPAISIVQQYSMDSSQLLTNGAGIAFCVGMIKAITGLNEKNINFFPVVYEFDKILSSRETINSCLLEYYSNNEDEIADEEIQFRLNGENRTVRCSLFDQTFEKVNSPTLIEALDKTLGSVLRDNKSRLDIKIISVGGFSNLICVNKVIAEQLNTGLGRLRQDPRIGQLTKTDKYLAVAYGAALYASKEVIKSSETSFSLRLVSYDGIGEHQTILLQEGKAKEDYFQTQWLNDQFSIIIGRDAIINLIISSKKSQTPLTFRLDISETCMDDCSIQIGVRLSERESFLCIHNNLTGLGNEISIDKYISEFENMRL